LTNTATLKSMTGLTIAGRTFGSRLLVGTGKFSSNQAMADCLAASGTEIVTVALRRADLAAAEILVQEGFTVLPYINADPVLAKRLQEVGTATVMPLGSPIGSNRGLETRGQLEIIIEQATVPVIIDAGLGAPSHAAAALELGADGVLVNTALAAARDPVRMARAFRDAVEAGRTAWEVGLGAPSRMANPTSPLTGFLS
jgi:thiazole synthase